MCAIRHLGSSAILGLLGLCLLATDASAGDRHWRGYRTPDADIEDLDAAIYYDRGGWLLAVQFEVEVEDAWPGVPLEMSIVLLERNRPVLDRFGRPVEFLVPLNRPVEIDDDELDFRDVIQARLPDGLFGNPKDLCVLARIIGGPQGRVLDDDDTGVSFRRAGPRFNRHRGPGQFNRLNVHVEAAW